MRRKEWYDWDGKYDYVTLNRENVKKVLKKFSDLERYKWLFDRYRSQIEEAFNDLLKEGTPLDEHPNKLADADKYPNKPVGKYPDEVYYGAPRLVILILDGADDLSGNVDEGLPHWEYDRDRRELKVVFNQVVNSLTVKGEGNGPRNFEWMLDEARRSSDITKLAMEWNPNFR